MSATLQFPRLLEIRVSDAADECPVPRIGLMLTIFAPRKNHYHLAKVTDAEGKALVTAAEMRESVRTDQEWFPMDYASSLEECSTEIEVKVCTADEVRKAVNAMAMFKSVTKIDDAVIRGFQTSRNAEYAPTSQRLRLDEQSDQATAEIVIHRRWFADRQPRQASRPDPNPFPLPNRAATRMRRAWSHSASDTSKEDGEGGNQRKRAHRIFFTS